MNQELSLEELFEALGKKRWVIAKTTAKERIAKLQKLRKALVVRQQEFYDVVWEDFHKPKTEAHLCEVYPALSEIDCAVAHLEEWVKDRGGNWSPLFPTNKSVSHFEPKGRVLIMAPWKTIPPTNMRRATATILFTECFRHCKSETAPALTRQW